MNVLDPELNLERFALQLLSDVEAVKSWLAGERLTLDKDSMNTSDGSDIASLLTAFDKSECMIARRAKNLSPETVVEAMKSSPELRGEVMRLLCNE